LPAFPSSRAGRDDAVLKRGAKRMIIMTRFEMDLIGRIMELTARSVSTGGT
jgi:hypothetical protein